MTDRAARIDRFLAHSGWAAARRSPLAGDASNRRYERLARADGSRAVLMDAPPDTNPPVSAFRDIALYLGHLGLSPPDVLACDEALGLMVLEDLGDALFANLMRARPTQDHTLYTAATDVLVHLHQALAPTDLPAPKARELAEMTTPVFDWYAAGAGHPDSAARNELVSAFHTLLERYAVGHTVLALRDFHAENLLWLPNRAGLARVGLLDFQDAFQAHRAYDLVSLLQDARRDVPERIETAMIARYVDATGVDSAAFQTAYAILGAQRNLRILGVFARLSLQAGRPHYVDFIPRVWGYVLRDLQHPALKPVAAIVRSALPEPTPSLLRKLKDERTTCPNP